MHFQTIIIGGGPAGLACASVLADQGIDTLLLERRNRIGPKVCAGGITWSGASQYIAHHIIEKQFQKQYITSSLQKAVISSNEPIVSTVDREKLAQWMVGKARNAGALIKTGEQVTEIDEERVRTKTQSYRYDFLVGADGAASLVRNYLGLPVARIGVGIQYHLPESFPDMVWHLDPKIFKTGYSWIFPHRHKTSIGAYACRQDIRPARLKAGLHHWMDRQGINRKGLTPEAALINFDYRGWRFGRRFLVGDAAGLASGITGEGIYSAILSGEDAAHCIADQDRSSPELSKLIKRHKLHTGLLSLIGRNRLTMKTMPELLIIALRLGLLNYQALELGSQQDQKL
ncbi:MAG: NAD(P)/FAD-dependent oxidoreductase [Desulfurivibrionaceae bacterium]